MFGKNQPPKLIKNIRKQIDYKKKHGIQSRWIECKTFELTHGNIKLSNVWKCE